MKVLHINKSDLTGGAALAAVRLLDALNSSHIDAKMLVLQKDTEHPAVVPYVKTRVSRFFQNLKFLAEVLSFVPYEKNRNNRFTFSSGRFGYDISRHPMVQEADILHLHWINQGFLSLRDLKKLLNTGKPVVWTLHDTWPFTGGCHYPGTCGGYTAACGQCPLLKYPDEKDLSARQLLFKESMYSNKSLTMVGCSRWMKNMAENSVLVRKSIQNPVESVFNPIDTEFFSPGEKVSVRQKLGLPGDKKLLLFGAANIADPRKGTGLLIKALQNLHSNNPELVNQLELVAFGKNISAFARDVPFKLHPFDMVASQKTMAELYSAADLFALPSMQDNLPNTVVEALSCGTPVVAFNIGGLPEMVTHQQSGYLAEPGKWRDLGIGILEAIDNIDQWGQNARAFAVDRFSPEVIAGEYLKIYNALGK